VFLLGDVDIVCEWRSCALVVKKKVISSYTIHNSVF